MGEAKPPPEDSAPSKTDAMALLEEAEADAAEAEALAAAARARAASGSSISCWALSALATELTAASASGEAPRLK